MRRGVGKEEEGESGEGRERWKRSRERGRGKERGEERKMEEDTMRPQVESNCTRKLSCCPQHCVHAQRNKIQE